MKKKNLNIALMLQGPKSEKGLNMRIGCTVSFID